MNPLDPANEGESRRAFLKKAAAAAIYVTAADLAGLAASGAIIGANSRDCRVAEGDRRLPGDLPWYRRVTRWAQVNIAEIDPARYDIPWWRNYWARTKIGGVIVNAGGIVAYYPSKIPLQRRAEYLGDRDLFGDICHAAHESGLAVFARMDSSKAHDTFYRAHPDWFAVDAAGKPYKANDLYVTCVNSPYYEEYIPSVLREIAGAYRPEGFTDNNWSGLGRESICYCENCRRSLMDKTGHSIPLVKNWDDPAYRAWIRWNYDRRLAIWDLNNRTTRAAGGSDCIWSGMNGGSVSGQSRSFRDFRDICRRAEIVMLDDQARSDASGFQHNAETGQLIHSMLGWDKLIPESMAMYQGLRPMFRLSAKPEPEARMWVIAGIAGGIQPWWHMLGAYQEDRRMYHNPETIFHWHATHEEFLIGRHPVATVGLLWSQQNTDFCGRDNPEELVEQPWRGMVQALVRARIPYLPVHADDIDREGTQLRVLVLPNLAVMTDDQIAAVRRFVAGGGNLVATGDSSLLNEWGDRRADYGLADLFGAHATQTGEPSLASSAKAANAGMTASPSADPNHSYLRLAPEIRGQVDGPNRKADPPVMGSRHEVLRGFEETDILAYGGQLAPLRIDPGVQVLATFIPPFPVFPPEKVWMRVPRTDIPGLILNQVRRGDAGQGAAGQGPADHGGRVVFCRPTWTGNLPAGTCRITVTCCETLCNGLQRTVYR
jgi:hypothetical protein